MDIRTSKIIHPKHGKENKGWWIIPVGLIIVVIVIGLRLLGQI